jgi:hypothetical protein
LLLLESFNLLAEARSDVDACILFSLCEGLTFSGRLLNFKQKINDISFHFILSFNLISYLFLLSVKLFLDMIAL